MGDDRPEPRRTGRTTGSSVLTPPTGLPVIPVVPDDAVSMPAQGRGGDAVVAPARPVPAVAPPVATPPVTPADVAVRATSCVCGHDAAAHEHWRRGSDCGACGATACPSYRRCGRLRRLLRAMRGR